MVLLERVLPCIYTLSAAAFLRHCGVKRLQQSSPSFLHGPVQCLWLLPTVGPQGGLGCCFCPPLDNDSSVTPLGLPLLTARFLGEACWALALLRGDRDSWEASPGALCPLLCPPSGPLPGFTAVLRRPCALLWEQEKLACDSFVTRARHLLPRAVSRCDEKTERQYPFQLLGLPMESGLSSDLPVGRHGQALTLADTL